MTMRMTLKTLRGLAFGALLAALVMSKTAGVRAHDGMGSCAVYDVDTNGLTVEVQNCGPYEFNQCNYDLCNELCGENGMSGQGAYTYTNMCDYYDPDWYISWVRCVCAG